MKKHIKRDLIGWSIIALIFIAGHFITVAQAEAKTEQAWPGGPELPHNDYLRVGVIIGSDHVGNGDWNEEHNGYYLGWKGFTFGQYENSYSEQDGRDEMNSSFFYYETFLHRKDWLETSLSLGLVDGYPDDATTFRRSTIPWVSFNIRFGRSIGAKLWHVPAAVTAYGIEYSKEMK